MASIRVKVTPDGQIDVGERSLPRMRALLQYLPAESRRGASQYDLRSAVVNGRVSPQDMANALCAYYAAQEHPGEAVYPAGEMSGPAYMASGDTLYQLVPLRRVSGQRALAAMRERLRSECRAECETLRTRAQSEVASIVQQAQERAFTLRQEAETVLRQARAEDSYKLPNWLWRLSTPLVVHVSQTTFSVPFHMRVHITDFRFGHRRWAAAKNAAFLVGCYLPVQWHSGAYNPETAHTGSVELPHMTTSSACVRLGDAPASITSYDAFARVTCGISRAFETINLASLLSKNWRNWPAQVRGAIPDELSEYFDTSEEHGFRCEPEGGEEVQEATWNL